MYKISTSDDYGDDDKPLSGRCLSFAATHATMHMRRRRQYILYDLILEMPKQPDQAEISEPYQRATLWEARCLLYRFTQSTILNAFFHEVFFACQIFIFDYDLDSLRPGGSPGVLPK
jgi:hypothetical protein